MNAEVSTKKKHGDRSWIADAAIFVAIPAFAYLCAYFYERGYAAFFGIPDELVGMDTKHFIVALLSLIVPCAWLNHIIGFYHDLPNKWHWGILTSLTAWLAAYLCATIAIYGVMWHEWIWLVYVLLIVGIVELGLIFRNRNLRKVGFLGYDFLPYNPVVDYANRHVGISIIGPPLIAIIVGCLFAFNCGRAAALKKEEYLVAKTQLVVAAYGDNLICTNYNAAAKTISHNFSVRKLGDEPSLFYAAKKVGPIIEKPKPTKKPSPTPPKKGHKNTMDNLPAWLQAIGGLLLLGVTFYYARLTQALVRATQGGYPVLSVGLDKMEIVTSLKHPVLLVDLSLTNNGSAPAVSVRIDGTVELDEIKLLNGQKSRHDTLPAMAKYDAMIPVIAAGNSVKPPVGNRLLFEADVVVAVQQAWTLDAFRDKTQDDPDNPGPMYPKLHVIVYYSNAIGESFETTCSAHICAKLSDRSGNNSKELMVVQDCGYSTRRIKKGKALSFMRSRRQGI